jgi:hypothetical protein
MKQTFKLISAFLLLSGKLFGQFSEMVFDNTTKTDKSLKEVWEYSGDGKDSSLTAKEYYSEGLLQLRQSFWNDTLRKEAKYKYNEYKLPWIIIETSKDNNKKDTSKSMAVYLYDQYKNLYLERHMDSVPDYDLHFRLRFQQFTNYIYQDSLIIYSNMINDLGDGFQAVNKKFEYDNKRHLKKIFVDDLGDTAVNYILTDELFYDKLGNHIKSIQFCRDYVTNREGNKKKQPCENDFALYTYNSKQQLTEEFHHYHSMPFMDVSFQKDTIKFNYDGKGRLVSVLHTIESDRKYSTNRYFKY